METAYDRQILREMHEAEQQAARVIDLWMRKRRVVSEQQAEMGSGKRGRGEQRRRAIISGSRPKDVRIGPPGHDGPKISLDRVWAAGLRALVCQPPPERFPASVNRRNFGRELIAIHGLGGVHSHIQHTGAANAVKAYLEGNGISCQLRSASAKP